MYKTFLRFISSSSELSSYCQKLGLFSLHYWRNFPISQLISLSAAAAAVAKSLQSCPTLCDPIDGSPAGSSIHGIFQARVLEWVATAFSNLLV